MRDQYRVGRQRQIFCYYTVIDIEAHVFYICRYTFVTPVRQIRPPVKFYKPTVKKFAHRQFTEKYTQI